MNTADLIIHSIGELATTVGDGLPAHGSKMSRVSRTKDAAIAIADGKIVACGPAATVNAAVHITDDTAYIDAGHKLVTAGFVDPHTHLIFGGNRSNEFLMRCQGKTYAEIANAGGGIVASMSATRNATIEELVANGLKRLSRMLATGTTSCEVKTGYGLDTDSELRMLEAILTLRDIQPVQVVPTFMPAHAFPPGEDRAAYVKKIIEDMLPKASRLLHEGSDGRNLTMYNDVFCDEGYFSLDDSRAILSAGARLGIVPRIHSDEFANLGATALAVELKAASADHLLNTSDADIECLAGSNTIAILLPGTSFFLNLKEHARARAMIDRGVAVALGTDFNPGSCHISSVPLIFGLACMHLKMTVEEALTAVTYNAAHAIGLGDCAGELKPGKQADVIIFDVASLEEVPYNIGWNPIRMVIKAGSLVHRRNGE